MANQPISPSGSLPQGAVCPAWNQVSLSLSVPRRGFENPPGHNLCYRNAALTLFLHTPEFLRWCEKYCGQAGIDSVPELVRRLYDVINAYWKRPEGQEQALATLWTEVQRERYGTLRWETKLGDQHDAHEMLEKIILLLWTQASQPYNDELRDFITVALSRCTVCKTCKQKDSLGGDEVQFLRADLPAASIEDAIINGMKSEIRSDCKTCATKETFHEIQSQILVPSELLVVQVNRFNGSRKLQDEIEFQEELVIPDSILDDGLKGQGKIAYELYAVIFHIGATIAKGHYIAAVKGPSGQWFIINDTYVSPPQTLDKSMTDGGKKNAYILAYRRVEIQSNSADSKIGSSAAVGPASPKASSTDQSSAPSGNPIADSSKASGSEKGSVKGGVQMKATIKLNGRPIQWTINQQLVLDPDKGALVALKGKARTQRARLQLTFTSEETGEILDGRVTMSLKPRKAQKPKRAPSETADTKDSSDTVAGKAAKPKGVKKKVSSPRKGTRHSARLRSKAEK